MRRMTTRSKVILVGIFAIALAALPFVNRGSHSNSDSGKGSACCLPLSIPNAGSLNQTSPPPLLVTSNRTPKVIAYYFHGTVRCETCLKIEKQANEVIERQFRAELHSNELSLKSVNYEQPENTHFLQDYRLPCPSLVLVGQKDGKQEPWKLLGETWKLVEDPMEFNRYVEAELRKFLNGPEQETGKDQSILPDASVGH
jgi:hypothetical protein